MGYKIKEIREEIGMTQAEFINKVRCLTYHY